MKRSEKDGRWGVPHAAPSYDFCALAALSPTLRDHMRPGTNTVDFSRSGATLAVTTAILRHRYDLSIVLPAGHLVPTVPARRQYLSWAYGLLPPESRGGPACLLDVGAGPSAIYSLLACRTMPASWRVVATDVDPDAVSLARRNVSDNSLSARIAVLARTVTDSLVPESSAFPPGAPLRLTVCNPPWYDHGTVPDCRPPPGTSAQLETKGGELQFLSKLARDSRGIPDVWFTSLVGIKADVEKIARDLRGPDVRASQVIKIELSPGGRTTRWAIGWKFGSAGSSVNAEYPAKPAGSKGASLRVTLVLTPAAQHAGNMSVMRVSKLVLFALADEGWSAGGESGCPTPGQVIVMDGEGGKLQYTVSRNSHPGIFNVLVKVVCRGASESMASGGLNSIVDRLRPRLVSSLDNN
jgi:23S rRNA A1618 N6-methylase RlmF